MGDFGVVLGKALRYGSSKVTNLKFDADTRAIHIGNRVILDAKTAERISSHNGSIRIAEANDKKLSSHHPDVEINLKEVGLHFTVKFHNEHLDILLHSSFKGSNTHGLIGEKIVI